MAWIPHTLYFISLSITILGAVGALASLRGTDLGADGLLGVLVGVAVWILITLLFRAWAVRANRNSVPPGEPAPRPRRRIATFVVAAALALEFFFVWGSASDDNGDFSFGTFQMNLGEILGGSAFFLAVALLGWIWRRRITRRASSQTAQANRPGH